LVTPKAGAKIELLFNRLAEKTKGGSVFGFGWDGSPFN
jgi:hypothetical protein